MSLSAGQTNKAAIGGVFCGCVCGRGRLSLTPTNGFVVQSNFLERVELKNANVLPFLAECRLRGYRFSYLCQQVLSVPHISMFLYCVVPENIHAPPTEGFSSLTPPPHWIFRSRGLCVTPPTPWNFHDFFHLVPRTLWKFRIQKIDFIYFDLLRAVIKIKFS